MDFKEGSLIVAFGFLGAAAGFGGAMVYIGGTVRQVEVNMLSINEIRDHGTGILQALKLQVQVIQAELDSIKKEFRPREYWERNAADIATLKNKIEYLDKVCSK